MTTLIDALLRQQVYYEMWKEWEGRTSEQKLGAVIAALIATINRHAPADTFADMTLAQVRALTNLSIRETTLLLNKLGKETEALIKDALVTVEKVTLANYNNTEGGEVGRKRLNRTRVDRTKEIFDNPAAGPGLTPKEMIANFNSAAITRVRALIQQAYAEKWTVAQLVRAIRGTIEKGYKDGLLGKLKSQFGSVVRTLMQHVQAWVDYNIGRLFFKFYQWCSILDSVTTEICRSRHRKIYEYGRGPVPPAHYNCRSRIMGVAADAGNQMPNAFFDWLSEQPDSFLADILLPDAYRKIKNGEATRKDHPSFTNHKTATKAQFEKRATVDS